MTPRLDWLARLLERHRYTIEIDGAVERRARLHHDRLQRELEKADPEEWKAEPTSFEDALTNLIEIGLEADEAKHGLAGSVFGDVISKDVMDEGRRRRRGRS